jgi:hypothetical protein
VAEAPGAAGARQRPAVRVVAVVALWAVVVGATSFAAGCYGHNCDGSVETFGQNTSEGRLLSADLWESGPVDGVWLDFPRQRVWVFDLTTLGNDRVPQLVVPYVSAQVDPVHEGGNWTIAAGNLAEQSNVANGQVVIKNGTCADYYLRVVVQAAPRPAGASVPSPPSADADADASVDAGADAGR